MYKLKFEDNTEFIGGSIDNSKWSEAPDKRILDFTFHGREVYQLAGFEKYNMIVSKSIVMNSPNNIKAVYYDELYLMGLRGEMVYMIKIILGTGQVTRDAKHWGHEYRKKPTTGWKTGKLSGVKCRIGRIA